MVKMCRIEYPGAFYHVTNRGNRRQPIFRSDDDRYFFLNCLREAHSRFRVVFHAYCLMENHYHLFLETPRGNLSRIMHLVDLKYSAYFNLTHSFDGHTFQGPFTAVLVQAGEYAREVAPYIHLNPVRARLVEHPRDYAWSNYRQFMGLASPEPWTSCSYVLSLFGDSLPAARRSYEQWVMARLNEGMPDPLAEANRTGILGDREFIDSFMQPCPAEPSPALERDLTRSGPAGFRPTLLQIRRQTESVLGPDSRLGRRIAIYLSHEVTDLPLSVIGEFFSIGGPGISDVCRRTGKEIVHNGTLARVIEEIELRLREECRREAGGT